MKSSEVRHCWVWTWKVFYKSAQYSLVPLTHRGSSDLETVSDIILTYLRLLWQLLHLHMTKLCKSDMIRCTTFRYTTLQYITCLIWCSYLPDVLRGPMSKIFWESVNKKKKEGRKKNVQFFEILGFVWLFLSPRKIEIP